MRRFSPYRPDARICHPRTPARATASPTSASPLPPARLRPGPSAGRTRRITLVPHFRVAHRRSSTPRSRDPPHQHLPDASSRSRPCISRCRRRGRADEESRQTQRGGIRERAAAPCLARTDAAAAALRPADRSAVDYALASAMARRTVARSAWRRGRRALGALRQRVAVAHAPGQHAGDHARRARARSRRGRRGDGAGAVRSGRPDRHRRQSAAHAAGRNGCVLRAGRSVAARRPLRGGGPRRTHPRRVRLARRQDDADGRVHAGRGNDRRGRRARATAGSLDARSRRVGRAVDPHRAGGCPRGPAVPCVVRRRAARRTLLRPRHDSPRSRRPVAPLRGGSGTAGGSAARDADAPRHGRPPGRPHHLFDMLQRARRKRRS